MRGEQRQPRTLLPDALPACGCHLTYCSPLCLSCHALSLAALLRSQSGQDGQCCRQRLEQAGKDRSLNWHHDTFSLPLLVLCGRCQVRPSCSASTASTARCTRLASRSTAIVCCASSSPQVAFHVATRNHAGDAAAHHLLPRHVLCQASRETFFALDVSPAA